MEAETVQLIQELTAARDLAKKASPRMLTDVLKEWIEQLAIPERTQSSAESIAQKEMEESELKKRVAIAARACETALVAAKEQMEREEEKSNLVKGAGD